MLDTDTKRRIDTARDILVGKVPDPKSQVEQITIALIYKFMDDMDLEAEELGGKRKFFAGDYARYGWAKLMRSGLGGHETLNLYAEAIAKMPENPGIPPLFREIFKNAFLPYRDPETLRAFLKIIDEFEYDHSERLGDAFEYLLSVLGSQGDAGQFRTPRHIIDFIVEIVDPKKTDTVLDPACGTAGFLISSYKHILKANTDKDGHSTLTPDERGRLAANFKGYDISPDMVRLSRVNMYLHGFTDPHIYEYDTLTSQERWNEYADVILANPPFMSPKGGIKPHNRFSVQSKRSEVLFVDYMAEHLTPSGRAGIIVPEGIIFQSQTAYRQLRKMLVEDYLVAVVSLPAGVFNPYSGVKTSILLLDKALARQTDRIAFFKINHDGFNLGAQRRPIDKNDLPQARAEIAEYLRRLRAREPLDDFQPTLGLVVPKEKIAANDDYNLTGERYREGAAVRETKFPRVSLGDLLDLEFGTRITKRENEGTLYPVYGGGGESFRTDTFTRENDVVVSRFAMSAECVRVISGRFYLLDSGFTYSIAERFSGRATKEYVTRMLLSIQSEIYACGRGHAQKNIDIDAFKAIEIPLPPLEVQKEIVAEIEGYQKVIDGARAVLDNYRPHIPIHPDWPMVELGEVCEKIQYGLSVPLNTESSGFKTFRMNELVEGKCVDRGDMKYAEIPPDEFEKYRLNRGDILFNRTNSFEHVGRTGIFDLEGDYCFASYLIRLTIADKKADPFFINAFMNSESFQQGIKQFATRAIGQSNINAKTLAAVKVPLPPLETQRAIVAEIEAEQALVNANRELIARMEKKIQATLARVWGEDEPAPAEA
ncbi:N-6 DNA methylase [Leptothermofonsia sp. ETS-13]|uniref:N-6 DNA methylase n=1 Tax=Leptothermofonsia sp. ETS-13 TaxID=3035696 RepID=UPI003BA2A76E